MHFHNFESQIKFLESLLSLSFFSIFSHISSFSSCPNNNPRIQWMRRSSPTLSLPIESSFSESHLQPSLSLWHSFRYPQRRQTLHPHCRTTPWLVPETKCEQDRQLRMVSWMWLLNVAGPKHEGDVIARKRLRNSTKETTDNANLTA